MSSEQSGFTEYPSFGPRRVARAFFSLEMLLLSLLPLVAFALELSVDAGKGWHISCMLVALLGLPTFYAVYINQWSRINEAAREAHKNGRQPVERWAYRIFTTVSVILYVLMIAGFGLGSTTMIMIGFDWLIYIAMIDTLIKLDEDRTADLVQQRNMRG